MKKRTQWRCNEEQSTRRFRRRLIAVGVIMGGLSAVIGWRLVDLQVINAAPLAKRAERQQERLIPMEGERGTIYDHQGRVLAMNSEMPSLFAVPSAVGEPKVLGAELASILERPKAELVRRLSTDRAFIWLDRQTTPAQAKAALAVGGGGVGMVAESRRFYPKRSLMAHLIGFTGLDNEGLEGIELRYDPLLRGERGWRLIERDAAGRVVLSKGSGAPKRGHDLRLTVDEVIQYETEEALDAVIQETQASSAIAIMMEPATGAILAMAVRPEFNPNRLAGLEAGQWRNRAITDLYEPGSTIKPLMLAGALEEKAIALNELFDCEQGRMMVANKPLRDHIPFGLLTPREIIQHSSNIGAAKIGMRLGAERLRGWLTAFGLGRPTGIDLKGEANGLLRPVSQWSGRSVVSHAIGQEVGVTPLQLVTGYAALANGGWMVKPHLVEAVIAPDGIDRPETSQPIRRVISERTARQVRDILTAVTGPEGTGAKAALTGFSVAGKTGTAQKVNPETRQYDTHAVVSSFIGFVPAESPKFVLLVVVDEPQGLGWGGTVAAPVFRRIAEATLHYMGVMPAVAPPALKVVEAGHQPMGKSRQPGGSSRPLDLPASGGPQTVA
ncbi:MAG: penicillin-binding protein 2, partial [Nitrospirae bacterium]|nr:penicillin-binding protein 2 [Nitrospirota bacterium]